MVAELLHRTRQKLLRSRTRSSTAPAAVAPDPPSGLEQRDIGPEAPEQLDRIAYASVQLAALGPRLATLGAEMETQAQAQARRAATIAETMERLTLDLERAVAELRESSGQVGAALATVARIADHTRILSINASIEAARAGEQGRAFAVVVDEVHRLADRTGETTHLIEDRVQEMQSSIVRVAAVTGDHTTDTKLEEARTAEAVNGQVHGMAHSAERQLEGAKSLHALGDHARELAEQLLLSVGVFRFAAHARAECDVERLLPELVTGISERDRLERKLAGWLQQHDYFELVYFTGANGRQIVDNIGWRAGRVAHDPAGFGRDWTQRPWYREALRCSGVCSTDIYRSTATGDFCFTVAVALRGADGAVGGVLAADVNFQRLLNH